MLEILSKTLLECDRDSLLHLTTFLSLDDNINLSKTCRRINNTINHVIFKKFKFDWSSGFDDIKLLVFHSKDIEFLEISDCDFTESLLLDFPKLKSLTLRNCNKLEDFSLLEKYKHADITIQ